jgi:starvation-inducible outer membrane lipoprotein
LTLQQYEPSVAALAARGGCLMLLLLGLLLSSCAKAPPPPPSEDEQKRAFQALDTCLIDHARLLDDHRSEAQTIADAVLAACAQQQHTAIELYGRRLSPQDQPAYRERTQEATRKSALQAVLNARRAQGKHP